MKFTLTFQCNLKTDHQVVFADLNKFIFTDNSDIILRIWYNANFMNLLY
jgi:hypothetical protein